MIDIRMKLSVTLLALFVIWGLTSVEGLKVFREELFPLQDTFNDSDQSNNDNANNKENSDIEENNDEDCDFSSENCNENKWEKLSNEKDRNILVQSKLKHLLKLNLL
ncbi:hypothetical protein V1478_006053 [Vespula squamosa]|uniref:Uncharacterized protein n=1 Tax=Vespula squamosa TaxID=30214 RepID=A0ABD2B951_VESSQ